MIHPYRKNHRLSHENYTKPGGYFVTICAKDRKCIFSHIVPGNDCTRATIQLTPLGKMAKEELIALEPRYGIKIPACVIMPNHIHMIVTWDLSEPARTLGAVVGAYKSLVAKRWRDHQNRLGLPAGSIWQRDYYDHVLRGEADFLEKTKYIDDNPDNWCLDDEYGPVK